jgi:hypothetical protein
MLSEAGGKRCPEGSGTSDALGRVGDPAGPLLL